MPYYCTVPQCTSMAGKAKNVSFHQFPRDQDLAKLWNHILKRGKPYTKYSKVCSLHFRPEDYTITSVGKNKGQWRTLRKDALPSRNLPSDTAPPPHRRGSGAWLPPPQIDPAAIDPQVQMQMAQAIYIKTMMSMQNMPPASDAPQPIPEQSSNHVMLSDALTLLLNHKKETTLFKETSFKCKECSKCFKDPDVFVLHRRSHVSKNEREDKREVSNTSEVDNNVSLTDIEQILQNRNGNEISEANPRQETLRANPILANLLRSGIPNSDGTNVLDVNNILSIENQIMAALAASMENYIRNLSSMLAEAKSKENSGNDEQNDNNSENNEQNNHDSENNSDDSDSEHNTQSMCRRLKETENVKTEQNDEISNDGQNSDHDSQHFDIYRVKNEQDINSSFGCEDWSLHQTSSKDNITVKNENETTENDAKSEKEELITLNDLGLQPLRKQSSDFQNFEDNYVNFLNDEASAKLQKPPSKRRKLSKKTQNSLQIVSELNNDKNHLNHAQSIPNCLENELLENNQQLDKNFENITTDDKKCTKNGNTDLSFEPISDQNKGPGGPTCDNDYEDLNESIDSDTLVIDDSV